MSASRTTIAAVASWIARSGGVPSRPASAVTTPLDRHAAADRRGSGPRRSWIAGRGRSGSGSGWVRSTVPASASGVGVGRRRRGRRGLGSGDRARRRVGRRRRRARRSASASASGAAGRRRARRPASRGGDSRRRPVPLLSRWPSGPAAWTTSPVCDRRAGQGAGGRHDPERTGAVVDRDPEPVGQRRRRFGHDPARRASRTPSRVSSAPPVVAPSGSGSGPGSSTCGTASVGVEDPQAEVAAERAGDGHDRSGRNGLDRARRRGGPRSRPSRPGRTRSGPSRSRRGPSSARPRS